MDIYFDNNGFVICNGFKLCLTRDMIFDMQKYGYDPLSTITMEYNKMKPYIREYKLKKLGL